MIELSAGALDEIVVVGAHCDDIAIGMGGTLLSLARADPGELRRRLRVKGFGKLSRTERFAEQAFECSSADRMGKSCTPDSCPADRRLVVDFSAIPPHAHESKPLRPAISVEIVLFAL